MELDVLGIVVYGSVAREDAQPDSDVDVLLVYGNDEVTAEEYVDTSFSTGRGLVGPPDERVITETWFTRQEFEGAVDAGSQFLGNVLDEGIVLYDPEGVIRDAGRERASESVPR